MPPISQPGDTIVVTDAFRGLMEEAGLSGMQYRPVIKGHIAYLQWERWNLTADEPAEYPESGEPEDYILLARHSAEAESAMGIVWEVSLEEHAILEPYQGVGDWDQTDWLKVRGLAGSFVSERARAWLESTAGEWVSFKEIPLLP